MKKLLVVLLALTFVFVMASVTLAVVTSSVDGKVEWTYKNGEQFGGSVDGKIVFDLAKDFGEGYSAGLKIKLTPGDNANVLDTSTPPAKTDVDKASAVAYDGDGWIKMVKDFGTFTFQTGGLNGNAANELGVGFDMAGNPGVKFESTSLVDGLSLTVVVNDAFKANTGGDAGLDGNYANYLLKGVYATDTLTIGAGYQTHTQPPAITNPTEKDAMAVWGSYKLGDALSLGLEYASRPNEDAVDPDGNAVTGSTAILAKCDYTAGALTINGKVLMTTGSVYLMDPDDISAMSAWDLFRYGGDKNQSQNLVTLEYSTEHADPEDGSGIAGMAVKIDVAYQITDAMKVTATVEDIMDGAYYGKATYKANKTVLTTTPAGTELGDKQLMSYKLGVNDKLSEKLTLDGWYAGYGDLSEIGVKASYAFVAGLDGSLEVKSNSTVGSDAVNTYTATIKATL